MNNTQLIGHLGADPDVRSFESGAQRAQFTLYLNERYTKDGQTAERRHRFTVEAWDKTAEFVANYLRKGSKVAIAGSLAETTWTDANDQSRSRVIIRANRIENLTPKKADKDESASEKDGYDDF